MDSAFLENEVKISSEKMALSSRITRQQNTSPFRGKERERRGLGSGSGRCSAGIPWCPSVSQPGLYSDMCAKHSVITRELNRPARQEGPSSFFPILVICLPLKTFFSECTGEAVFCFLNICLCTKHSCCLTS